MKEDLKYASDAEHIRAKLSHMANTYYYNYKPSRETLRKHGILNKLKKNEDIVITRPDKGSELLYWTEKHMIVELRNSLVIKINLKT